MKNLIIILKAMFLLVVLQSCSNVVVEGSVPECEWNDTDMVQFYDLQLRHPSSISIYHSNLIPLDNIERSLINILETNGDAPNDGNSSYVKVNLIPNVSDCYGDETVKYHNYDYSGKVGASNILVPFVSNADFWGEVTVTIRTDVFNNTVGSNAYYHVLWEETGNNPNGGFVGDIYGTKVSHINIDGDQSLLVGADGYSGYIYQDGIKIWL